MVLTVIGTTDVIRRYVFNNPIQGAGEVMTLMLGAVAFLSFSYVQLKRGHITVSLLSERLGGKKAILLDTIFLTIMLILSVIIGFYGGKSALAAWQAGDTTYGIAELPLGPARLVVPLGFGLLSLRIFRQLIESIHKLGKASVEYKSKEVSREAPDE